MLSLVESVLPLRLDIYKQFTTQDPDTGGLLKQWHFHQSVACSAKGHVSNSGSGRMSNSQQDFGQRYQNTNEIQIRTEKILSYRDKITNIRDINDNPIWFENNSPNNTPTVFEIIGSTPIIDPFGTIIAYNSIAKRSENQIIGPA